MKKCQRLVEKLPESCPLKHQCAILVGGNLCNTGIPEENHPPPCYGNYCTCEIALDGGKVEEIKTKRTRKK